MKKIIGIALVLLGLTACTPSPWDGYPTQTPEDKLAETACSCLESHFEENGVDIASLLSVAADFKADREQVRNETLTDAEMRAKYPTQFEIAESLPSIMNSFGNSPCNLDVEKSIQQSEIDRAKFSRSLEAHCLLSTYFKR